MKIYTRSGDLGETGLAGGSRVKKTDVRINAVGSLDECNAQMGIIRSHGIRADLDQMLQGIQSRLFDIGAIVASGPKYDSGVSLSEQDIVALERLIDLLEAELQPLQKFILPGGHPAAAHTHLARTVCRRAEREVLQIQTASNGNLPLVFKYLNRLSDFLFVLARTLNAIQASPETTWR